MTGRKWGGETMRIGEATEKSDRFNGLRVRAYDGECGTIYNVYVSRERRLAQIWVNMDAGGARCFRPHHLVLMDIEGLPLITGGKRMTSPAPDCRPYPERATARMDAMQVEIDRLWKAIFFMAGDVERNTERLDRLVEAMQAERTEK